MTTSTSLLGTTKLESQRSSKPLPWRSHGESTAVPRNYEITPHLFNKVSVAKYIAEIAAGKNPAPPKIVIELFMKDIPELQRLRGNNNSQKTDCVGVKLIIAFDDEYADDYTKLLENRAQIKTIPTEYYKVTWYSFANNAITPRSLKIAISNIDATTIRLQSGTDYFLQEIINGSLDAKEKVSLAIAYRKLKEQFAEAAIAGINNKLTENRKRSPEETGNCHRYISKGQLGKHPCSPSG